MRKTIIHIVLGLLTVVPMTAQSVKDLQREQMQIQQEMEETNRLVQQTKKTETATVNKLTLLNKNIKDRKRLINSINSEISALDSDMGKLTKRRGELSLRLEALKADYANLVRKTHYADMQSSPLLFLMSSKDFQQLYRRIRYMREFTQYRKQQVAEIEQVQTEIDIQNSLLEERKNDREKALKTQKREKENLDRDERKQQQMLKELKKKKNNLLAQQKKQQKKADELNKKIEELIRKQTKNQVALTKEQKLLEGGFEQNKGRLPWPVEKGFISGFFGTHQHPVYEHVTVNNKGIYIQTTAGSRARAVYDGEVTTCAVMGNTYAVIVQHGNYRSVYSNLKDICVKQGDKIKTKQAIGTVYTDPNDDNKTVVFFQIYYERTLQNPALWLAQ